MSSRQPRTFRQELHAEPDADPRGVGSHLREETIVEPAAVAHPGTTPIEHHRRRRHHVDRRSGRAPRPQPAPARRTTSRWWHPRARRSPVRCRPRRCAAGRPAHRQRAAHRSTGSSDSSEPNDQNAITVRARLDLGQVEEPARHLARQAVALGWCDRVARRRAPGGARRVSPSSARRWSSGRRTSP